MRCDQPRLCRRFCRDGVATARRFSFDGPIALLLVCRCMPLRSGSRLDRCRFVAAYAPPKEEDRLPTPVARIRGATHCRLPRQISHPRGRKESIARKAAKLFLLSIALQGLAPVDLVELRVAQFKRKGLMGARYGASTRKGAKPVYRSR